MAKRTRRPTHGPDFRATARVADAIVADALPCRWCGSSEGIVTYWRSLSQPLESCCINCGHVVWLPVA